jgi:hypothetical protein
MIKIPLIQKNFIMKKIFVLPGIITFYFLVCIFACNKTNEPASASRTNTTQIKPEAVESVDTIGYSFTPVDTVHIIRIVYTDTLGEDVSVIDLAGLHSWSVRFPVRLKPFVAKIRAEVINLTGKTSNYTIAISLNGNTAAVVPMHVDTEPGAYVGNAEYTLQ